MMRKYVPKHIRAAIGALAHANHEYAIGIDFEEREQDVERVLINRGSQQSVLQDADLELLVHTHPYEPGLNANAFPSGADLASTSFLQPNLIAYIDENGKKRFTLIRSLNPAQADYKATRLNFNKTWDEMLKNYYDKYRKNHDGKLPPWTFGSRDDRKEFWKKFKAALNEKGYDIKSVSLDAPLDIKLDDVDERHLVLHRYNKTQRRIARFFGKDILKDHHVWHRYSSDGQYLEFHYRKDLPESVKKQILHEMEYLQDMFQLTMTHDPDSVHMPFEIYRMVRKDGKPLVEMQAGGFASPMPRRRVWERPIRDLIAIYRQLTEAEKRLVEAICRREHPRPWWRLIRNLLNQLVSLSEYMGWDPDPVINARITYIDEKLKNRKSQKTEFGREIEKDE